MISNKDLKKKIKKYITQAQIDMDLQRWRIIIYYDKSIDSVALCERDREYLRAWITFNLDKVAHDYSITGKNTLLHHCYHEVAHILLHELEFLAKSRFIGEEEVDTERERIAESVSKIILKLKYNAKINDYTR